VFGSNDDRVPTDVRVPTRADAIVPKNVERVVGLPPADLHGARARREVRGTRSRVGTHMDLIRARTCTSRPRVSAVIAREGDAQARAQPNLDETRERKRSSLFGTIFERVTESVNQSAL
jgi:hypothetical protein